MKTEEDEAFEDIERKQGGGFHAKRAAAADKLQEPEREALKLAVDGLEKILHTFAKDGKVVMSSMIRNELFAEVNSLLQQAKAASAQPAQEPVATIDSLEQEIYENTREFVSLNVMEWLLNRLSTTPPQRTEQEQPLPPVEIGVDVTADGASVVAFYRRPNAVMEMFYSQFHPAPQRPWVGLTDEEMLHIGVATGLERAAVEMISNKLKDKNT